MNAETRYSACIARNLDTHPASHYWRLDREEWTRDPVRRMWSVNVHKIADGYTNGRYPAERALFTASQRAGLEPRPQTSPGVFAFACVRPATAAG